MGSDPFEIMWRMTMASARLTKGALRSANAANRYSRLSRSQGSIRRQYLDSMAAMERGVLAPGDPPPIAGGGDFLDYRGIALSDDLGILKYHPSTPGGSFPVGRLLHPRYGPLGPVAIPFEVLRRHAVVIGGAGTGKTASVIVPWICAAVAQGHFVVATDVKGDLLNDVLAFTARFGSLGAHVAKWDFTDPSMSIRWNWIEELTDDGSIDAAIDAILGRENRNSSSDPFFYRRDATLLRGLLRIAPLAFPRGATARDLLTLLTSHDRLIQLMASHPAWPGVQDLASSIGGIDPVDHGKVVSGVATAVARLDNPGLNAVTRSPSESLSSLLTRPALLVVAAPLQQGVTSRVVSTLLLNLLVQRLYTRFGKVNRHCFLFVDEAPRIVDRFAFEEVLSVSRSAGVSVVLAAQDVSQFKDQNDRSAILGNCSTAIVMPGGTKATTEWAQSRIGTHTMPYYTTSKSAEVQQGLSVSLSTQMQATPVLGDRELAQPPFGHRPAFIHIAASGPHGVTSKPLVVDLQF